MLLLLFSLFLLCAVYIHEIQLLCAWQRCCCFLSYFFFSFLKKKKEFYVRTLQPSFLFLDFFSSFSFFKKIYFYLFFFLAFPYSFHPSFFVRAASSCRTSRFLSLSLGSPLLFFFSIRCKENITQPWLVQFDSISSQKLAIDWPRWNSRTCFLRPFSRPV